MAHQIENNEFAYIEGQPAWHGLGTAVPAGSKGVTFLKAAGLDYPVEARSLVMRDALRTDLPPGKVAFTKEPLKDYKAIVNGRTQKVFNIMSSRYHIVQNEEVVRFFDDFVEAGDATMETVGALRGGAQVWALAKLKGGDANLSGVDALVARVLMMTAHDGSSPTIAKAVQTRVVCGNTLGMALGEKGKEFRVRHSREFTQELANAAKEQLGMAVAKVQKMNALAEKFSKVPIDGRDRIKFLQELLNKKPVIQGTDLPLEPTQEEMDRVLAGVAQASGGRFVDQKEIDDLGRVGRDILAASFDSPGATLVTAKDTLWGLVNGVTFYVDHQRGRSGADARLSNAWFGAGATMKEQAVQLAADMAGVTA